jgi:hypothetical protein
VGARTEKKREKEEGGMALPKPRSEQPVPESGVGMGMGVEVPEVQVQTRTNGNRKKLPVKAPAFIKATSPVKPRWISNIQGPEKTGKDHMGLSYTGPGNIYIHSFDIGLEGVVQKFQDKGNIYVAEYELTIQPGEASDREVGEAAGEVWDQFVSNYRDSLASTREGGLVMIDTGTEAWELLRLASFGKLTQVMPHHYSKPNAEFRDLVREGFDGMNVAWLHKMKDEYENYVDSRGQEKSKKTGNKTAKMMNDMPFLVQVNVQTERVMVEGGGAEFKATIVDCRHHPEIIGMEIPNTYDALLELL